jgi:hypothetical protein
MAAAVGENTAAEINGLKRKADMQMMYCTVCNIFLNSSSQADAHFSGKSHKNKAKSRGLEVGVLRCPFSIQCVASFRTVLFVFNITE